MENKKLIIGIIIVVILIIGIAVSAISFGKFDKEQVKLLADETNKLLETDIEKDEIDLEIKTKKNYAIVEKSIKEYLLKLKNIYVATQEIENQINPNEIFSAQNIEEKDFSKVDEIIKDYKEKAEENMDEYKNIIKEENILDNINNKNISGKEEYYVDLYKTVMLSDSMKQKFETLGNQIERQKDGVIEKLNNIEKIKKFLEENDKYWEIKDEKIQFNSVNKITEYYNLLNKFAE